MPTPGSSAPFVTEIELISGGRTTRINPANFFQSLETESSAKGSWTGTLTLWDNGGEFLEDLMISSGVDRTIRMRWNFAEFGLDAAPLLTGLITVPNFQFQAAGILLNLELLSQPFVEAVVDRRQRTFPAGKKISEMVQAIATDRGWKTIDRFGNGTLEATKDEMTEPFSSAGESDIKFINDQLKEQAINTSDIGDFNFFFDMEGAVHFHSQNFIKPRRKTYTYARGRKHEVLVFSPSDTSILAQLFGGGKSITRSSASKSATQTKQEGEVAGGVEGRIEEVVDDSQAIPDIGDGVSAIVKVTARDEGEIKRIAKTRRDKMKKFHITATLEVIGTHDLRVTDYIRLIYLKTDGSQHYLSGSYWIAKVKHRFDNSGWRTTFDLMKEGLSPQPGTTQRSGTKVIVPTEIQ